MYRTKRDAKDTYKTYKTRQQINTNNKTRYNGDVENYKQKHRIFFKREMEKPSTNTGQN